MIKFKKTSVALSVIIATGMLTACGGGGDQDSQASNQTSFTGLVIDAPIVGAHLFVDINGNGRIDSFERSVTTNSRGRYNISTSPTTGYVQLISIGGTDSDTQESWTGTLSATTQTGGGGSQPQVNLTPITTMVASVTSSLNTTIEEANQRVLQAVYGSNPPTNIDLSTFDYTNANLTGDDAANALTMRKAAVKLAQTVESANRVLSNSVENVNGVKLGSSGIQNGVSGASQSIYAAIAENLLSTSSLATSALANLDGGTDLSNVMTSASNKFVAEVSKREGVIEAQVQAAVAAARAAAEAAAKATARVAQSTLNSATDANGIKAATIVTATVVDKADKGTTSSITSNIDTYAQNVVSNNVVGAVNTAVANANAVDVGLLSSNLGDTGTNDATTATNTASLEDLSGDIWSSNFLTLSGKDSDTKKGRVILFFDSYSDSDSKGKATVCYAYKNGSEEQTGRITGDWAKVGEEIVEVGTTFGNFQIKAYRVQTVSSTDASKFLGLGTEGVPGTDSYGNFLFTSSALDEDATWYSDISSSGTDKNTSQYWGLRSYTTAPTSLDQCKGFFSGNLNNTNPILTKNVF